MRHLSRDGGGQAVQGRDLHRACAQIQQHCCVHSDMAAYLIAVQCEDLAVEERQVLDRMNERMKARKKEEINLIPLTSLGQEERKDEGRKKRRDERKDGSKEERRHKPDPFDCLFSPGGINHGISLV